MEKEFDLHTATLDEIVFEDRNKAYGGYFLRVFYEKNVTKAVLITCAAFAITAASINFYYNVTAKPVEVLVPVKIEMDLTKEPPKEEEIKKMPPPPPKVDQPKLEEVKFVPPVIKIDKLVQKEEQIKELDSLLAAPNISDKDVKGKKEKDYNFDDEEETGQIGGTGTEKTDEVFTFAQEMPKFKGTATKEESIKALEKYVNTRVIYPESARQRKIEGVVYVRYTVTKEGKVTDVQIVQGRGLDPAIDAEAIRVIKSMPDFTPASQNGVLRAIQLTQRIKFTLQTQ